MKIFTAPQHTRFILPPIHPTKFFACLAGRYFSFGELYLEFYISRLNEIPPAKRNRAFPTGNALLYISLSSVVFGRVRPIQGRTLFLF